MNISVLQKKINQPTEQGSSVQRGWKLWQLIQQSVAAVTLLLLLPLLIFIYLLVKKDSKGPFLYSQVRPGLNGRRFTTYKSEP